MKIDGADESKQAAKSRYVNKENIDTSCVGSSRLCTAPAQRKRLVFFGFLILTSSGLLLLQLQLGLAVVLGRVDAVVGVVDEVGPRQDVGECGCVARVPVGNALHVLGHLCGAVQRLATLDLVDHLAHVLLNLAAVLARAVEAGCLVSVRCFYCCQHARGNCRWNTRTAGPRVCEDEAAGDTNGAAQTHDGREATLADERGRDALPVQHQTGADGTDGGAREPVRGAGIADYSRDVSSDLVSTCAQAVGGVWRGVRHTGRCR